MKLINMRNEIVCDLMKLGLSPKEANELWLKIALKEKYEDICSRIHLWGDTEKKKPKLRGLRAKMHVYDDAWEDKNKGIDK